MEAVGLSVHELSRSQESVTDRRTDGRPYARKRPCGTIPCGTILVGLFPCGAIAFQKFMYERDLVGLSLQQPHKVRY